VSFGNLLLASLGFFLVGQTKYARAHRPIKTSLVVYNTVQGKMMLRECVWLKCMAQGFLVSNVMWNDDDDDAEDPYWSSWAQDEDEQWDSSRHL
jgi:hypothetical protein